MPTNALIKIDMINQLAPIVKGNCLRVVHELDFTMVTEIDLRVGYATH